MKCMGERNMTFPITAVLEPMAWLIMYYLSQWAGQMDRRRNGKEDSEHIPKAAFPLLPNSYFTECPLEQGLKFPDLQGPAECDT